MVTMILKMKTESFLAYTQYLIKHLSWAGKKGKRNENSQQNKLISQQNKYTNNNFDRCKKKNNNIKENYN